MKMNVGEQLERMASSETCIDSSTVPLIVDLDGTLFRSDFLVESCFQQLGSNPRKFAGALLAMMRGKAALKSFFADGFTFNPGEIPYDENVLLLMRDAFRNGRPVYIASASHTTIVAEIARSLDCVTGWLASDEAVNLSSAAKAKILIERFGSGGFDYIGNHHDDIPVWKVARRGYVVRGSSRLMQRLRRENLTIGAISSSKADYKNWIKLLRVHQYLKNALVFLPVLTSHSFNWGAIGLSCAAAMAFSLCASGVYILNDLVDLGADRGHPTKRQRPLACGAIDPLAALAVAPALIFVSLAVALAVSPAFAGVVVTYLAMTTVYTFFIKRIMLADVVILALLYTIRVIGGAVAIDVPLSQWIMAFSLFVFVALALIKRYTELSLRMDRGIAAPSNRDYGFDDLPVIGALGAASAMNAVTVFALYVASDAVQRLYTRPQILWLACPILVYWLGRCLMLAQRRMLDDDPIVFALRDRVSRLTILTVCIIVLCAI